MLKHFEVLEVSPSGYYVWHQREQSQGQQMDAKLRQLTEDTFVNSRNTYGSDCIRQALQQQKRVRTSRKRAARLMQERYLRSDLTQSVQNAYAYVVGNLLAQDSNIPTHEGWLYLSRREVRRCNACRKCRQSKWSIEFIASRITK